MTAPCKDCPHRSVSCHVSCESYTDYRKKQDEILKQRNIERENYTLTIAQKTNDILKNWRKKNK